MQVVHIETRITTLFGVVNDDGDVVEIKQTNAGVTTLTHSDFLKLCDGLRGEREKLRAALPENTEPVAEVVHDAEPVKE